MYFGAGIASSGVNTPAFPTSPRTCIWQGLHGHAGDWEKAKAAVAEVLRINPAYRLTAARRFYLSSDQARQGRFVDLLREAGLPD